MGCIHSVPKQDQMPSVPAQDSPAKDIKINMIMEHKRDANRRGDIFAESVDFDQEDFVTIAIPKSNEVRAVIEHALNENFLFASLSDQGKQDMVDAMSSTSVAKGEILIKQGSDGDYFYVVEKGHFEITVNDEVVDTVGAGFSFGELALLYNCPRAATVVSKVAGTVWQLERLTFRRIVAKNMANQVEGYKETLRSVPLLEPLTEEQLGQLAQAMQVVTFHEKEVIITKGDPGNVLYVLKEGTVVCKNAGDKSDLEELQLGPGDYFGERALMTNEPRAANVIAQSAVTAFALDRDSFNELLGPLREVIDRNMGIRVLKSVPILLALSELEREKLYDAFQTVKFAKDESIIQQEEPGHAFYIIKAGSVAITRQDELGVKTKLAEISSGEYFGELALLNDEPRQASVVALSDTECFSLDQAKFESILGPLQDIMNREAEEREALAAIGTKIIFEDLEVLSTLGTGTFGRVKIAHNRKTSKVYALKVLQKAQVVQFKQKANVVHEKQLLSQCNHPFILKLHQSFKDATCLYLLLELVQGGELFTYLHNGKREEEYISEGDARFFASNVVLALEYLHERNIVYRDLKPENLLIDHAGYIKVVDFGFAKVIPNRSYTLCGTPEYLSPELVLGKGHNKGVDYWALGVLIFEMVVGQSPFAADDPGDQMQICRNIVSGKPVYPTTLSAEATDLIQQLLSRELSKRLGTTRTGSRGIRMHGWFDNIVWQDIVKKRVTPPWVPAICDPLDTSNFDPYEEEEVLLPYKDDGTNWDADF